MNEKAEVQALLTKLAQREKARAQHRAKMEALNTPPEVQVSREINTIAEYRPDDDR